MFEPTDDTAHVYERTTKFMIQGVLDGYNATVFAYGQTGGSRRNATNRGFFLAGC